MGNKFDKESKLQYNYGKLKKINIKIEEIEGIVFYINEFNEKTIIVSGTSIYYSKLLKNLYKQKDKILMNIDMIKN
jgi:hypothetical protein